MPFYGYNAEGEPVVDAEGISSGEARHIFAASAKFGGTPIIIFGSRAKGTAHEGSDWDFMIVDSGLPSPSGRIRSGKWRRRKLKSGSLPKSPRGEGAVAVEDDIFLVDEREQTAIETGRMTPLNKISHIVVVPDGMTLQQYHQCLTNLFARIDGIVPAIENYEPLTALDAHVA